MKKEYINPAYRKTYFNDVDEGSIFKPNTKTKNNIAKAKRAKQKKRK